VIIGNGLSQMFAVAKLADMVNRVKPEGPRQRETRPAGLQISGFRKCGGATLRTAVNYSNRPVRTRMPGGGGVAPCKRVEVCRLG
jgi:hypothetical protein